MLLTGTPGAAIVLLALAGVWPGSAQSNRELELPRRLVKLMVAATDTNGEPVTDLRMDDIQIREDGKSRQIFFFRLRERKRRVTTVVAREFANGAASTPTVILLDRWNERMLTTAASWIGVSQALRHLESSDGVYVYLLTNHGDLFPVSPLPGSDGDTRVPLQSSPIQAAAALDEAVKKLQGFRDVDEKDTILRANATFAALDSLGVQMSSIPGRKNLIWVTHGLPLGMRVVPSDDWVDFTPVVRRVSEACARNGIVLYTVAQSAAGAGAEPGLARALLEMFSTLTGGRFYPSDYEDRAITESMTDGRGSYTIAYYSPMPEKDRKYHKIRLTSTRNDVRLLTRAGYYGEMTEPQVDDFEAAALGAARRSPLDATEIGLRVVVTPDSVSKTVHFQNRVDPADLLLAPHNLGYSGHLSVMAVSYAEGSFLQGASMPMAVDFDLTPEQLDKATSEDLTIPLDLPVSDTARKVRVIVFDRTLRTLGSVTVPVGGGG